MSITAEHIPFLGASVVVVMFIHQSNTLSLYCHAEGCKLGCDVQSATRPQILLVNLQAPMRW